MTIFDLVSISILRTMWFPLGWVWQCVFHTHHRYGGEYGKYTVILTLVAPATALGTSLGWVNPYCPSLSWEVCQTKIHRKNFLTWTTWCTGNNVLCEELHNKHERLYNKFSKNITITVPTLTGLIVFTTHYKEFVWQSESLLSSSVPASSQA